jgi:X-Pro dipeptidyl-peptidase
MPARRRLIGAAPAAAALVLAAFVVPATTASTIGADGSVASTVSSDGSVETATSHRGAATVKNAWVRVPGLDSDSNGRDDRVHVQYHVPRKDGAVPVILEASPYLSGGNRVQNHDVDVPLHIPRAGERGYSSPYEDLLRPRGYAYVYAESIGSGSSTGCPPGGRRRPLPWSPWSDG